MLASITRTVSFYAGYYYDYGVDTWENITPSQYGILLVSIGVMGWFLMKKFFEKNDLAKLSRVE